MHELVKQRFKSQEILCELIYVVIYIGATLSTQLEIMLHNSG